MTASRSMSGLAGSQPHTLLGCDSFQLPLIASAVASRSSAATMLAGALKTCSIALIGT